MRGRDEKKKKKRRERSEESKVRGREKVERTQNKERERNSEREMTFMTPSHALLFTKLPLHHSIKIFLLNK